jgi:vacuolar protein sorting-associated protein 13A/C
METGTNAVNQALDKFRLPIDVVEGHLGELTLQIPWSNLKNKPVKIFIENVYLLAIPKANQEVSIYRLVLGFWKRY